MFPPRLIRRIIVAARIPLTDSLEDNLYHARRELEKHTSNVEQEQAFVDQYQKRITRLEAQLRAAHQGDTTTGGQISVTVVPIAASRAVVAS